MNILKIVLYGIGGLYNYGCEAIVRGTTRVLQFANPKAEIIYFSPRADEDKEKIQDLNISVVQTKSDFSIDKRIVNKMMRIFKIPYRCHQQEFNTVLNNADVIISIGGDMYTIPQFKLNSTSYEYYNKLVHFGEMALRRRKKVIIYGASVGPFGSYKKAKKYYLDHLSKVDLIVARERRCIEYLYNNNISKNVGFLPDPAFMVQLDKGEKKIEHRYIGMNFSPLSLKELYGEVTPNSKRKLADIIEKILSTIDMPIMFVPHVLSPKNVLDNDLLFMEDIWHSLSEHARQKVMIAKPQSFLEAKVLLRKCRIVAAVRMHCAINAICEGTPTLFISYSEKARGMASYIYGNEDYVISLKNIDSQLIEKMQMLLNNENSLRQILEERVDDIQKSVFECDTFIKIKKVLE